MAGRPAGQDDVTQLVVGQWLGTQIHNAEQLAALRTNCAETCVLDERPFTEVVHWAAFEVTWHADPLGAG